MTEELTQYEKIITINHYENDYSMERIFPRVNVLLNFIEEKCVRDKETLEYFQLNFKNSERNPFAKDLKIKWAVQKIND